MLARERDLAEFEIYCASAEHRVARLAYTSDIPSRGVEELKSHVADGFTLRVVMRRDAREIGVATEAGDLSLEALRAALTRARSAALVDPHFPGLPRTAHLPGSPKVPHHTPGKPGAGATDGAVGGLMRAGDAPLVESAWRIVGGALEAFTKLPKTAQDHRPGLVLGGDVSLMRDRMALASSNFDDLRTEAGAHFTCTVTALVESLGAKGTASALGATLGGMRAAAARAGRDAVVRALALGGGETSAGWDVSRGVWSAASCGNTQLHGDSLALNRRVSRCQHGLSWPFRCAGDGRKAEPARRSGGGAGRDSSRSDVRGTARAPHDNDSGRAAGRVCCRIFMTAIGSRPTSIEPRNSGRSAPSRRGFHPTADIVWAKARCAASTPIRDLRLPI